MKPLNPLLSRLEESIFSTITQLSNQHQAINLAQGFPDFEGPQWVLELAQEALLAGGKNQYAPSWGLPALRQALADSYRSLYGLTYDPAQEILVTNGATEAIYATIAALVSPRDEVVAFEPLYDSYLASVTLAQGNLKTVTLNAPGFGFDLEELKAQVGPKTKLLILNSPHNPTGKVFSQKELEEIAQLAERFDFYILSDEVYEFLTYQVPHLPVASLPGMQKRVITCSSVGKTFSLTGWKIGWVAAPKELAAGIHKVHQYLCFCVTHPLQVALAKAWPQWPDHLTQFRREYQHKRDLLAQGLTQAGFEVLVPQGTYFLLAQTPPGKTDLEFCRELILDCKVATIPTSVFYQHSDQGKRMIRFCFAKRETTLNQALAQLQPRRGA
ncbi:MAG: hypothetical protein A2600_05785 [Candidatus Lambdaproteobacteria bacterium RIFOXYD1_FULL_56_27]|uniref:Aminotransferase class I/classII large domain-containing protein n=1 Tax=Candidatus Lambdaproteobacteria bacterium RIFOXYD2_FULL_56_26 TaxID=1817773 RepID=A0A1F6GRN0_9PROT|nr:MAG: hypothetical protein A2426_10990 [Candidatus Lambdaproteobacteria bacterium RIFOXYC1_FULL_56_13]OGH00708.1 MAG: hypothetical protein A2557_03490 [Candidatus Lambdaproteobacteria bacterium RIFOXYD2_FULL_56_26]OGH07875.1 MAG: hypothetical protein A2600_05785 [Candidatus Lambdaproteobacteria bacterium RIFOXYD1_FULL_56_27]